MTREKLASLKERVAALEDRVRVTTPTREQLGLPWFDCPAYRAIGSDTPQNVDPEKYRGFHDPDYDGHYLLAESIPDAARRAFLVQAANNHHALIEALEGLLHEYVPADFSNESEASEMARAALKNAGRG